MSLHRLRNLKRYYETSTRDWHDEAARDLQAVAGELLTLPPISVICGSTSQREAFERLTGILTLQGRIVLGVGVYGAELADKAALDELHLRKIDLADEAHFIHKPDGSLGESTAAELEYAQEIGVPIVHHYA